MTIGFCYEIQNMSPSTTVDTVPSDFKLDNFTLREAMKLVKFLRRFSRSISSNFFKISLKKSYAETILEMSKPDFSPASYAKSVTYLY